MSESAEIIWFLLTIIFAVGIGITGGSLVSMFGINTLLCWGISIILVALTTLLSALKFFAYSRKK